MKKIFKSRYLAGCGLVFVAVAVMVVLISDRSGRQTYEHNKDGTTNLPDTTTYRSNAINNNEGVNYDKTGKNGEKDETDYIEKSSLNNENASYIEPTYFTSKETINDNTIAMTYEYYDNASESEAITFQTKEHESTVKYVPVELTELSEEIFVIFKHQTTNTVWNGHTTAKVMHPDQLEYLNDIADRWYKGNYSVTQLKDKALNDAPIKTNEDMLQLTGYYQEFIGDEALFKVVDVDAAKIKFEGKRTSITEEELWQRLCDEGEDSATANFLYVKACYNEKEDNTYVYYFDCKLQWINNNFQW